MQKIIVKAVLDHLQTNAEIRTKKKKQLQDNPIAPWELRIGDYRVFYEIEENCKVNILAIGHKEHNDLFIRGNKVEL